MKANPQHLSWLLRADLRQGQGSQAKPGDWFTCWWAINGRNEYPSWADAVDVQAMQLLKPLPNWPSYGAFGMTPFLHFLLQQRSDLPQAFDVHTQPGLWHAIAWQFTHGLRELQVFDAVDAPLLAALDETPPFLVLPSHTTRSTVPVTWLMFFVWRCNAQLQAAFDLRTPQGQMAYVHWFLCDGVPTLGLAPLVAPRWRQWLLSPMAMPGQPALQAPRAAVLLSQRRPDLVKVFDLRQPQRWLALAQWARQAWQAEPSLRWLTPPKSSPATPAASQAVQAQTQPRPFGLNLIGFAFGELGIGEDVRMAAAACEAAGIPFKVVNIHPGDQVRQGDQMLAEHVAPSQPGADPAPYATNVFCLTGFDTVRVFLEQGKPLFEGRYNIGWWPWELPVWPQQWDAAFSVVDEVWAATTFTQRMYQGASQRAGATCPVRLMPLPASVARVKAVGRGQLGLPPKRFLFLYVFDFNSFLARKNPFATLRAFTQAFAPDDNAVGLVMKTMNSQPNNPEWQRFVQACSRDARITLLDHTLDRPKVLGLIKACDAYVSLHRSEGFGRTLAEAMLFGKPVVGTDFSGNTDFLTQGLGFPVRWRRRPVKVGEYAFVQPADAAWWAEPDIAHAAKQMQDAVLAAKSPVFAKQVQGFAQAQFSPARIGQLMKQRAQTIWESLPRGMHPPLSTGEPINHQANQP